MKEKTAKVYFCEYCGKHSLSKGAMVIHERACSENPANVPLCRKCRHFRESFSKKRKFSYPNPEYDIEAGYGSPYITYEMWESTCQANGGKLFHARSRDKVKTIMSQSDWKPCPMMTEGCKNFDERSTTHE